MHNNQTKLTIFALIFKINRIVSSLFLFTANTTFISFLHNQIVSFSLLFFFVFHDTNRILFFFSPIPATIGIELVWQQTHPLQEKHW